MAGTGTRTRGQPSGGVSCSSEQRAGSAMSRGSKITIITAAAPGISKVTAELFGGEGAKGSHTPYFRNSTLVDDWLSEKLTR